MFETIFSVTRNFGAEAAEGGIVALGVDFKALILQIITFVIVFLLLKKYALDKIVAALEERRTTINQGVLLGQKMIDEKERLDEQVEKVLHKARLEADKIIAAGHKEAGEMLKQAESEASRKTDAMIADAHARIEDDITRAKRALEKEMLSLVSEATEVIIDEKLDKTKDSRLIDRLLHGVRK